MYFFPSSGFNSKPSVRQSGSEYGGSRSFRNFSKFCQIKWNQIPEHNASFYLFIIYLTMLPTTQTIKECRVLHLKINVWQEMTTRRMRNVNCTSGYPPIKRRRSKKWVELVDLNKSTINLGTHWATVRIVRKSCPCFHLPHYTRELPRPLFVVGH